MSCILDVVLVCQRELGSIAGLQVGRKDCSYVVISLMLSPQFPLSAYIEGAGHDTV